MTTSPQALPSATGRQRWGWLTAATAVAVYLLIVLGGVVRITGSGMGCGPDWPLCNGQLVPTMDLPTFIEWVHRLVAAAVSILVFVVAARAWWPGRRLSPSPGAAVFRRVAAAAVALLVLQVLLGAVTVWMELPPASVILHLGTAMVLFAVLLVGGCRALTSARRPARDPAGAVTWAAAGCGLLVVLAGALVANLGAAPACQGFPLCNGSVVPEGGWRIQLHWGHRLLAYLLVAWVLYLPVYVGRRRSDPPVRAAAGLSALLVAAQLGIGAVMVLAGLPKGLQVLHLAAGTALFGALVVTAELTARTPISAGADAGSVGVRESAARGA